MMKFTESTSVTPKGERRILVLPEWNTFSIDTIIPELEVLFVRGRFLADEIALISKPTFNDIVLTFEKLDSELNSLVGPLRHLNSTLAKSYPNIQSVLEQVEILCANYGTELAFHEGLYQAYKRLSDGEQFEELKKEEQYLVYRTIRDFELAGVSLPADKKMLLKELNEEGAGLAAKFSKNDQESTDEWSLVLPDATRLTGVSGADQQRMKEAATKRSALGYVITLQQPDAIAIMTYADDRSLRKEVSGAWATIASEFSSVDGKWDNTPITRAIVTNAHECARVLGYSTFVEMSLEKKMAASVGVEGVKKFLTDLAALARPKATLELEKMSIYAKEHFGIEKLESWDLGYVEERMRKELYAIDSEYVRQYFPFTKVMEGLSETLWKLFSLRLILKEGVSTWHSEVKFYEVHDSEGVLRGAFYADMYAREGKRSGAWMDSLLSSRVTSAGTIVPVAYLNCNASRSSEGEDAYLTHDQVETLFHELGHTLHHVLGGSQLSELSMEHVEWDTVELPSQFFENWTWEESALQLMSAKKGSGEIISSELISKMHAARNFNSGLYALRQVLFGLYDWELYSHYKPEEPIDPMNLWWTMHKEISVSPIHPQSRFPNGFHHIFGGGYRAGYFSYMWALGLAADSFQVFKEAGDVFSHEIGMRFLNEIIIPGSSRPMAESFERFRGRPLNPRALALPLGLIDA